MTEQANQPKPAIYRHFKGGEYRVLGVGRHSDGEELFVVYEPRSESTILPEDYWIRPLAEFMETVERDGYRGPRFELIREE